MSKARAHKKGGGVAILFNDSFHCIQMSYGKIASFKCVALQLNSSCSLFFKASLGLQAGLLSIICIDFDCGVIVGDFKIHVHNPQDSSTKALCCILSNWRQHLMEPTHKKWHTLDKPFVLCPLKTNSISKTGFDSISYETL